MYTRASFRTFYAKCCTGRQNMSCTTSPYIPKSEFLYISFYNSYSQPFTLIIFSLIIIILHSAPFLFPAFYHSHPLSIPELSFHNFCHFHSLCLHLTHVASLYLSHFLPSSATSPPGMLCSSRIPFAFFGRLSILTLSECLWVCLSLYLLLSICIVESFCLCFHKCK